VMHMIYSNYCIFYVCTPADMNTLQHVVTHGNTLQYATTNCNTFNPCMYTSRGEHCATQCNLCNTLQHTATHCNTLQHAAIHCNTLQHAAIHCNTLRADKQLPAAEAGGRSTDCQNKISKSQLAINFNI